MEDAQGIEIIEQWQLDDIIKKHSHFLIGKPGGARAVVKDKNLAGLNFVKKNLAQADFSGSIMSGSDFSASNFESATLFGCDFSSSNLKNANFSRTDLRGADLSNSNLTDIDLTGADLREGNTISRRQIPEDRGSYDPYAPIPPTQVDFSGSDLSNAVLTDVTAIDVDFSNTVLTGSDLKGADLQNSCFKGADLSHADLSDVDMRDTDLGSAILLGVDMDAVSEMGGADLTLTLTDETVGSDFEEFDLTIDEIVERHTRWVATAGREGLRMNISDYDMRSLNNMTDLRLTAIRALNTVFSGMSLNHSELQSSKFDYSDLRKTTLNKTDLRGSSFKDTLMDRASAQDANINALKFTKQDGSEHYVPCDFSNASMVGINFSRSQMNYAVFNGTNLSSANFSDCDLRNADFTGAQLKNANFSNALLKDTVFDDGVDVNELPAPEIPHFEESS